MVPLIHVFEHLFPANDTVQDRCGSSQKLRLAKGTTSLDAGFWSFVTSSHFLVSLSASYE